MKNQNFIPKLKRHLANKLASQANEYFHLARKAYQDLSFWQDKLNIMNKYVLNSKITIYMLVYVALLYMDAEVMRPIIEVVVNEGLQLEGQSQVNIFIAIYIVLVVALTLGVGSRIAYVLDPKLFELKVEFSSVSNQETAHSVLKTEMIQKEQAKTIWAALFGILLLSIVICLALCRNYLTNSFSIQMKSPDQWVNVLIPISIILALCYFGIYKDVLVKKIELMLKIKKAESNRKSNQEACDEYTKMAAEQNDLANQHMENTIESRDLKIALERYSNKSPLDKDYYDDLKYISVNLMGKSEDIESVQIFAITGDNATIYCTTNNEGKAILKWRTDSDYISSIRIASKVVQGTLWMDGDVININLDDF